jgi:hypothetical protein
VLRILVKPSLAIAVLASGCISESTTPATTVTAAWTFENLATQLDTGCPAGFDTARLVATPTDGSLAATHVDLDCGAGIGVSDPLAPIPYAFTIQILDSTTGAMYAQSLPASLDLTDGDDQRFDTVILNDAGYAHLVWSFVGAMTGAPIGCADQIDGIVVTAGTYTDSLRCEDVNGLTKAIAAGTYAFSVEAQHLGAVIGAAPAVTGTIGNANQVTDLGTIQIAIAGQ